MDSHPDDFNVHTQLAAANAGALKAGGQVAFAKSGRFSHHRCYIQLLPGDIVGFAVIAINSSGRRTC